MQAIKSKTKSTQPEVYGKKVLGRLKSLKRSLLKSCNFFQKVPSVFYDFGKKSSNFSEQFFYQTHREESFRKT